VIHLKNSIFLRGWMLFIGISALVKNA